MMKRKISAILAADIVKYSKLVAEDEEETVRRLGAYRTVFEELATRYGGRIVNMVGDAVLAEFASSVDAARCAIDVQETMRLRNQAYPDSRRMLVRIGLTLADIMDKEGELFGDGVNIAARLESLAPAGGICVSQTVREQVAGKITAKFQDIGEQRVKNIPNPIRAYVIPPHAEDGGRKPRRTFAVPTGRALAAAVAIVAACTASIVAAVQFHRAPAEPGPAVADRAADLPAVTATPAAQPIAIATASGALHFDETKVRTMAERQSIPLPPTIKVQAPAASVPANISGYLGAWGGDKRWNNAGRPAILIVESIDQVGTARGVYAVGLPLASNANQNPAHSARFAGNITDKGLRFTLGSSTYTFMLTPDGALWGQWDVTTNNSQHFDLAITLNRIE
ncbi:MAG TPA: adenylate/guanylate cyclase domain-containing protein [Xanthobacteraceae bacterium]|nr:adenylate/guanylate cyclase domain-containing protein [Xanthobacteraceae bacterium]